TADAARENWHRAGSGQLQPRSVACYAVNLEGSLRTVSYAPGAVRASMSVAFPWTSKTLRLSDMSDLRPDDGETDRMVSLTQPEGMALGLWRSAWRCVDSLAPARGSASFSLSNRPGPSKASPLRDPLSTRLLKVREIGDQPPNSARNAANRRKGRAL